MQSCYEAYSDNKRETLNSLLREQIPLPERSPSEEIKVKIASCVCLPLKYLESIALLSCGLISCPIPCASCEITSQQEETDIFVKDIYPVCSTAYIPCQYQNKVPSVSLERSTETRTATRSHFTSGYNCLSTGILKLVNTAYLNICCPLQVSTLAYSQLCSHQEINEDDINEYLP